MQNLKAGFLIKKNIRIKQVPPHETQSNIYAPLLVVPYNGPNSPLLTLSLILLFLLENSPVLFCTILTDREPWKCARFYLLSPWRTHFTFDSCYLKY